MPNARPNASPVRGCDPNREEANTDHGQAEGKTDEEVKPAD